MANKCTDINFQIQSGTARSLIVTWKFSYSDEKKIKQYSWDWEKQVKGSSQWLPGQTGSSTQIDSTTGGPLKNAPITVDDDAVKIRFRVRPDAKQKSESLTDASGKSQKSDSDSSSSYWFVGEWSSYKEFSAWDTAKNLAVVQAWDVGFHIITSTLVDRIYADMYFDKSAIDSYKLYIASFDYAWEGFNGNEWSEITSGSIPAKVGKVPKEAIYVTPDTDETFNNGKKKKKKVSSSKIVIRGYSTSASNPIDASVPRTSEYKQYRFTVMATADNESAFLPLEFRAVYSPKELKPKIAKDDVTVITQPIGTTDGDFHVVWLYRGDVREEDDHVEGFDIQSEYMYYDPTYVDDPSTGTWIPIETTTVTNHEGTRVEKEKEIKRVYYVDSNNNFYSDEGMDITDGGYPLLNGYEAFTRVEKVEKTNEVEGYKFSAPITLPDGVDKRVKVRFRIKINCDDSNAFTSEFSGWIYTSKSLTDLPVSCLSLSNYGESIRKFQAVWTIGDITNVSGFDYKWYYKTAYDRDTGVWTIGSGNGTLDVTQIVNGTYTKEELVTKGQYIPEEALKSWGSAAYNPSLKREAESEQKNGVYYAWRVSYEAPADAVMVMVEVTPVASREGVILPKTERAFSDITQITKSVENIRIQPYEASMRRLVATWTMADTTYLNNYECVWEFFYDGLWRVGNNNTISNSTYTDEYIDHRSVISGATPTSEYDVPVQAEKVRFLVRPVADNADHFLGLWSTFKDFKTFPDPIQIDSRDIIIERRSKTARTVYARFDNFGSFTQDDIWMVRDSQTWDMVPITVTFEWSAVVDGMVMSETIEEKTVTYPNINSSYEVPENADSIIVRMKINISTLQYKGVWSEEARKDIVIPEVTPEITELRQLSQFERTAVVTFSNLSRDDMDPKILDELIEDYTVEWSYYKDRFLFLGSTESIDKEYRISTYQPDDDVTNVIVRIKANPKYELDFKEDVWTNRVPLVIPKDTIPETPSTPTLEIMPGANIFRATVESSDYKTAYIEFQVVDEDGTYENPTVLRDPLMNRARFQFPVYDGGIFRVRARGINADGQFNPKEEENYGWSEYSQDMPSRPGGTTITSIRAITKTEIELEWEAVPCPEWLAEEFEYEVQYAQKKKYFDTSPNQVQSQTGLKNPIWQTGELEAHEWFFRVRAKNSTGEGAWSNIVSVSNGDPPEAPTTWSSRLTASVGQTVYLYWTHNAKDNSKEQKAEIELKVNGTLIEPNVIVVKDEDDDEQSFYQLPAEITSSEANIEWRVRTKGAHENFGNWSSYRTIHIYAAPTLSMALSSSVTERVSLAGNIVTQFPIGICLDARPITQTPISYILSIKANSTYDVTDQTGTTRRISAGQEIYRKYYNINDTSFIAEISPGEINLENGMSYVLEGIVAMNSGLTATKTVVFNVDWSEDDVEIECAVGYDPRRFLMYLSPSCINKETGGLADVTMAIYRREFDGALTKVAENISNIENTTVIDPHPSLDYARYRVVATSNVTGKVTYDNIPAYKIGEKAIIIQWNEAASDYTRVNSLYEYDAAVSSTSTVRLPFNVDTSDSNTVDVEMIEYIGRSHPVSYYGTQVGQKSAWTTLIPRSDVQTIYDLRRLSRYMGKVYVREPSGTGYWAHVEVSFKITHNEVTIPVDISVTRVEGGA